MLTFLGRRGVQTIPTLLGVLTVVFILMRLVPGDPAALMLGDRASAEALEQLRVDLGTDQPLAAQYVSYMADVLRGDFGTSIRTRRPVVSEVFRVFPHTLILAVAATIIGTLVGMGLGIVAAMRRNTVIDYAVTTLSLAGTAMPIFLIGMIFLVVFSFRLQWFPVISSAGFDDPGNLLRQLVLPASALGLSAAALIARMTRSSLLEVMEQDYLRTARAKGATARTLLFRHALRNALIPIVTVIGLNFGRLLGGTIITETLFVRPGIGRLLIDSIYARDYPQVEALIATFALAFVLVNLLVDITYGAIDPRVQYA